MSAEPAPSAARPSVLGLIPARGGSKGFPGKNIAPLAGIPLIAHTVRAALACRGLDDVVVSTDSGAIADACRAAGAAVPWLRPAELAGDTTRMQDVALHALAMHPRGDRFDYLLLLQPTAPLRTPGDIDAAIDLAVRHGADSVTSFTPIETHHPYYMYRFEPGDPGRPARVTPFVDYEPGLPRQAFPKCVYRNGAIYLVRRTWLLDHRAFVAPGGIPYLMPPERSANIDSPEDLALAEFLLARRGGAAP